MSGPWLGFSCVCWAGCCLHLRLLEQGLLLPLPLKCSDLFVAAAFYTAPAPPTPPCPRVFHIITWPLVSCTMCAPRRLARNATPSCRLRRQSTRRSRSARRSSPAMPNPSTAPSTEHSAAQSCQPACPCLTVLAGLVCHYLCTHAWVHDESDHMMYVGGSPEFVSGCLKRLNAL